MEDDIAAEGNGDTRTDGEKSLEHALVHFLKAPPGSDICLYFQEEGIEEINELLTLTPEAVQDAIEKEKPFTYKSSTTARAPYVPLSRPSMNRIRAATIYFRLMLNKHGLEVCNYTYDQWKAIDCNTYMKTIQGVFHFPPSVHALSHTAVIDTPLSPQEIIPAVTTCVLAIACRLMIRYCK
jgi:hypothetical protein